MWEIIGVTRFGCEDAKASDRNRVAPNRDPRGEGPTTYSLLRRPAHLLDLLLGQRAKYSTVYDGAVRT